MIAFLVALAGGFGAGLRFLADGWINRLVKWPLPVATLVINVTGSGLLGLLLGWASNRSDSGALVAVLGTGLLGGFTTFSTACVELVPLFQQQPLRALGLGALMLTLALAAAVGGMWLGTQFG